MIPKHTCSPGEKLQIDGIEYIGVSGPSQITTYTGVVLGGEVIIKNAKKEKIETIQGRQSSGSVIQLIPTSFIAKLEQRYEEGSIYDYEGRKHIAFSISKSGILGERLTGETLKQIANRNGIRIIGGLRNAKGTSINLIKLEDFNYIINELYKPGNKRV